MIFDFNSPGIFVQSVGCTIPVKTVLYWPDSSLHRVSVDRRNNQFGIILIKSREVVYFPEVKVETEGANGRSYETGGHLSSYVV